MRSQKNNHTFRLDDQCVQQPTSFDIDILIDDETIYNYFLEVLDDKIITEKLTKNTAETSSVLYVRNEGGEVDIQDKVLGDELKLYGYSRRVKSELTFLKSAMDGAAPETLKKLYHWFDKSLSILKPADDVLFPSYMFESDNSLFQKINNFIKCLDTGIDEIKVSNFDMNVLNGFPSQYQRLIDNEIEEAQNIKDGEKNRGIYLLVHQPSFFLQRRGKTLRLKCCMRYIKR